VKATLLRIDNTSGRGGRMWKYMSSGNPVQCNTLWLTVLLLLATGPSVYGQRPASHRVSAPGLAAGIPTARSLAYPQSVFVDSQNGNIWVTDFDNNRVLRFDVLSLTDIPGGAGAVTPQKYGLAQNYPNPFNPGTTITFALKNTGHATVTIYNLLGQEVATLFDRTATANMQYSLWFDATNRPSGMYLCVLRSADRREVRKMCFVK
jgi:hypothetical protein